MPWEGTAADIFLQLQFPLHSGRIAGIPGRIVLSFLGVVVAMLSLTGIVIWLKKRAARTRRTLRGEPEPRTSFFGAGGMQNLGGLVDRFRMLLRVGPG